MGKVEVALRCQSLLHNIRTGLGFRVRGMVTETVKIENVPDEH